MQALSHNPCLIVLTGPTASGKTALAINLAKHFKTEILSADSRQFYREMQIGTASPGADQLQSVRHHFIGHLSIHQPYNISMFEHDALDTLNEVFARNGLAILCGGSGLYIDAVCKGIDLLPDADTEIRSQLQKIADTGGTEALLSELEKLDPDYFAVVDQNNPKRLIRALEVCRQTGLPYSSFRKQQPRQRSFRIIKICIDLPREELHQRINQRVEMMFEAGLLNEAASLFLYRNLNALKTVGYSELFSYFSGKMSIEEAREKIKTNTRRYARRQLTWFRKDKEYKWFFPYQEREIKDYIAACLKKGG